MRQTHVNLHTSTEFERELQSIKTLVSEMGTLAQSMIEGAIEGFESADVVLLNQIFESEKRVDQLELEIDALCNHVLAVRQPTAVDMRLVVASIKIVREIERVGDEAEKIARISLSFHQHPDSENSPWDAQKGFAGLSAGKYRGDSKDSLTGSRGRSSISRYAATFDFADD
jgi:phosphate uptake regulator